MNIFRIHLIKFLLFFACCIAPNLAFTQEISYNSDNNTFPLESSFTESQVLLSKNGNQNHSQSLYENNKFFQSTVVEWENSFRPICSRNNLQLRPIKSVSNLLAYHFFQEELKMVFIRKESFLIRLSFCFGITPDPRKHPLIPQAPPQKSFFS